MKRFQKRNWRVKRGRNRPFVSLLPNIATILAMCCGMTAIRMSILHSFEKAIMLILVAAILDVLDGRLARLLGSTTQIGAELDSFSDLLNFGAAPALFIYLKYLSDWSELGWAIALFYTACVALRLARFNSLQKTTPFNHYFVGVPSTVGGYLVLWLAIVELGFNIELPTFYIALHVIGIGILMVSKVPTFAVKNMRVKPHQVSPMLLGVVALVGLLYTALWKATAVLGALYLLSIPVSYYHFAFKNPESEDEGEAV